LANTYKILGQARPADTAVADLYTVPAATQAVISTISATNVDGTASNINIYVVPDGGTASVANALVYAAELGANTLQAFTLGVTLGAADKISVQSATGDAVTYQVFGQEIS
jgi:hypothetical protein